MTRHAIIHATWIITYLSAPLMGAELREYVSLFDGKTLDGWNGNREVFHVVDGAIVGGTLEGRNPRNEFLSTEREYADFELRLKFKLVGEGANAGVQIRSRRIPNHHEMIGYQADLGDKSWWGCLYDESRRKKVLAQADTEAVDKVLKRGDWNQYVIRAQGRRIQLWINDLQTIDYTEPDESIEQTGLIAVQIHGGPPSQAWYKDIEIRELTGE
jgi:3-keto-disaccharide hydrolase